ncbi:MAG: hypothetical protein ACRD0B_11650, partial [Acidimicrobiales bacterium]
MTAIRKVAQGPGQRAGLNVVEISMRRHAVERGAQVVDDPVKGRSPVAATNHQLLEDICLYGGPGEVPSHGGVQIAVGLQAIEQISPHRLERSEPSTVRTVASDEEAFGGQPP